MKKSIQPAPTQAAAFLATRNRTTFHVFVSSDLQVRVGIGNRTEIHAWTYGSVSPKTQLIDVQSLVPESVAAINARWKTEAAYIKRTMGEYSEAERQKALTLLQRSARIGRVFEKLSPSAKAELVGGVIERGRILGARREFKAAKKQSKKQTK